jgi:hypothetical protein
LGAWPLGHATPLSRNCVSPSVSPDHLVQTPQSEIRDFFYIGS